MALTCDFKEVIQARVQRDPAFREELMKEGIGCMLAGDVDTGKVVLRDYIDATQEHAHESGEIMKPKIYMERDPI